MSDSNDNSAFCIRVTSKYGSNGGHTDTTAIMEIPPNSYDARLGDGGVFCNMIDGVVLGGVPGVLVYDTGARGCRNLLWLLGRGGPPKKSWDSVGLHSEGFLSFVRAVKSPSVRAISRFEAGKDLLRMRFQVQAYVDAADTFPVKNLDPEPFLSHGTLGTIECEEWARAADTIVDKERADEWRSLLATKNKTRFMAFWLEGTSLWPVFKAAEMNVNTNYYGLLTHPTQPLVIRAYNGAAAAAAICSKDTALDIIHHEKFPSLIFECASQFTSLAEGAILARVRIPGYAHTPYFTVNQDGKMEFVDAPQTFVPEFTCDTSVHSSESDKELRHITKRGVEDVRGVFLARNGVILGDPFWDDEFGDPRNAGGVRVLLTVHTENLTAEKNKLYVQDIVPTAAVKHTSNMSKAWKPVRSLLKVIVKNLVIDNYTGPKKPCKHTGVTEWDSNKVLEQLGAIAGNKKPAKKQSAQEPVGPAPAPVPAPVPIVVPTINVIRAMKKQDCVKLCEQHGLAKEGVVDILHDRLIRHYYPDYAAYSMQDFVRFIRTHPELVDEFLESQSGTEKTRDITVVYNQLESLLEEMVSEH